MSLHTHTHMNRETHTCMVEYKTDPDVLPCYNLCCSSYRCLITVLSQCRLGKECKHTHSQRQTDPGKTSIINTSLQLLYDSVTPETQTD